MKLIKKCIILIILLNLVLVTCSYAVSNTSVSNSNNTSETVINNSSSNATSELIVTPNPNSDYVPLEKDEVEDYFASIAVEKESVTKNSIKKEPSEKSIETAMTAVEDFLKKFVSKLPGTEFTYNVRLDDNKNILVDMDSSDRGYLIGYRGEVLNSLQQLLNNIANKDTDEKTRVLLNIGG